MNQGRSRMVAVVLLSGVGVLVLAGCSCPREREALEAENQALAQRIVDLETQVQRAQAAAAAASAPSAPTPAPSTPLAARTTEPAGRRIYTVMEGDSLWSIAQKELGRGARYREILSLNPSLSENEPLAIGTKLILPQ